MSSKGIVRALAIGTFAATCTLGAALSACSGSSSPTGGEGSSSGASGSLGSSSGSSGSSSGSTGSSGSSGSSGAGTSSGSTGGTTSGGADPIAACITACETQHPKGAQIGKGIDTCWANKCSKECTGIGAGQTKPPANGTCNNPVATPSAACSQCTVDSCCKAWDACFDDADCSALNTCSIACYP